MAELVPESGGDNIITKNMFSQFVTLSEALKALNPHDHLCLIYETEEEWRSAAISFMVLGLRRNEKCMYVVDIHAADQIRSFLSEEGVDTDAAEASGQLVILHETEAYTREGAFDPDKMIVLLIEETKKAVSEGFSALRVTGEMSWALRDHPGSETLIEYEAKLNRDFFPYYPCLAICQYHMGRFDPGTIRYVIMTHPLMVRNNHIYHNPYYIPPEEFLSHRRNHYEVDHWLQNLEHQSLVAETIRRTEELEALTAISATITQSLELEEVLNAALKTTLEIVNSEAGVIHLFDESSQTFVPTVCHGLSQDVFEENTEFKERVCERAAHTGKPVIVPDCADFIPPPPRSPAERWGSLVSFPLKAKGNTLGILTIISHTKAQFKPDHLSLLSSVGNQVGVAIENSQLYEANQRELVERRRIQEALRKSEKKYRDLVENMSDVIYTCNTQGAVTYISPAIEALTGFSPSEVIGRSFTEFLYKEDVERGIEMLHSIISDHLYRGEYRIITKSGDIRWMSASSRPIRERDRITGMQGILTDITERKATEKALKESEQKYRTFVSNLQGIAYRGDMNWVPLFFHGAVEEITGYTEEEFLTGNPRWDQVIHPDDWPVLAESAEKIATVPDYSATREYRIIRKDNKIRWVQEFIQNVCDDFQNPVSVQGIIYDITEHKKAKEEVMQLSTAVRMSSDSIIIADMEGTIADANDAALTLYRTHKKEDLIGKKVLDIIVPEDRKKVQISVEELLKKRYVKNQEYDLIVRNGTRITVETSMAIIETAEGTPRGFVSISRDITGRKVAEREMKRKLMRYDLREGNMYLVEERIPCTSLEAFEDLLTVDYPGLAISRTPQREFKEKFRQEIDYLWIAEKGNKSGIPPDLTEIQSTIEGLSKATAIFIDRLDYLLSKTSFEKILSFIHSLREIAYLKDHIIILSVDPSTLDRQKLRQIEKETLTVEPLYKVQLPEELFEVLRMVYEQNTKGMNPSYNMVGLKTGTSKPTARKRIRTLISYGYLEESKRGRSKILNLTEKGRTLFLK